MSNYISVGKAAGVTVDKELFRRDALNAQLTHFLLAAELNAVDRQLDLHAHRVNLNGHFGSMLKHSHAVVINKICVFIVR